MPEDIEKLKYKINYEFQNRNLLREALTHRSYTVEHDLNYDNQRLEFLGDAVLEIILTDWLFREYPTSKEGTLTKMRSAMACQDALATIARHLQLGNFIYLGHGEIDAGGSDRDSTLSDLMEALIGAFYLDCGYEKTKEQVLSYYRLFFPDPRQALINVNPKGTLQEYSQHKWAVPPQYEVVSVEGPDHSPLYQVSVTVNSYQACGSALNRKQAETQAARNLLQKLTELDPDLATTFL